VALRSTSRINLELGGPYGAGQRARLNILMPWQQFGYKAKKVFVS